jgi:hypothetical protein
MQSSRQEVEMRVPAGLFGGNPAGLMQFLGLPANHISGDRWLIQPPPGTGPPLTTRIIAGKNAGAPNFGVLNQIYPQAPALGEEGLALLDETRERLIERASSGSNNDLAALFHQMQVELLVSSHEQLPATVQQAHDGLGRVAFEGGVKAFPDRSVHLVSAS